jgi:hypothetical protein
VLGVFVMTQQIHIVDSLLNNGFEATNVKRHRRFTRAAVIAASPEAKYTMMVSPPLAEEDYWNINIYECGPREIKEKLPVEKEKDSFRPRHWCLVKNVIRNFLNNS